MTTVKTYRHFDNSEQLNAASLKILENARVSLAGSASASPVLVVDNPGYAYDINFVGSFAKVNGQITGMVQEIKLYDGSDLIAKIELNAPTGLGTVVNAIREKWRDDSIGSSVFYSGDDTLIGGEGTDNLYGYAGNDFLDGGVHADVLIGGKGADRLTGGSHMDHFVFRSLDDSNYQSIDTITDFSRAQGDRINLQAIDAQIYPELGYDSFIFSGDGRLDGMVGELVAKRYYSYSLVLGDTDGDAKADFVLQVLGNQTLQMEDFIL